MFCALRGALESFEKAGERLSDAVEAVSNGDIIEAVMALKEAEINAKSGAAVAKVADTISGTLLDILA